MAEEDILDPLRRGVTGVATGIGDAVSGIGQGVSNAVSGVGGALGGALGGFSKMSNEDLGTLANILGRTGSALMALGQPGYNPQLRQQALMALGNVPGQVATDRYKAAQSKLMMAQMQREQRKLDSIKKLDALRGTPEGIATIYKQTGFDPEFIKTADPEVLEKAVVQFALKRATVSPAERRMREILAGGTPATPPTTGAPEKGGAVAPTEGGAPPAAAPEAPKSAAESAYNLYKKALTDPRIMSDPKYLPQIIKAMQTIDPARYEKEITDAKEYQPRGVRILDQEQKLSTVRKEISNARNLYNPWSGTLGQVTGLIPTVGRDLDSAIKAIQSNLGFATLAQMRAESKSGGALGNVSDKDIELLHSTLGKLQVGMSVKAFNKALNDIEKVLTATQRRSINIFEKTYKKKFDPNEFGGSLETYSLPGSPQGGGSTSSGGYRIIGVR